MNALVVGADKSPLVDLIPSADFLLIDDGPIIDQLSVRARQFDPLKHSLNPLRDISYRTACDFVSVVEGAFPGGENTLTRQNTSMQVLTALLDNPRSFGELIQDTKETKDAYNKIQRLLVSPILKPVLTRPPSLNFSMNGKILARLDRAELGDFDCFVLGNLLASRYPGTVIIPDFGFYGCGLHRSHIRQERLVAGVNSLGELDENIRRQLLITSQKMPSRTTYEDAKVLADYLCENLPHTDGWNTFIEHCVEPL